MESLIGECRLRQQRALLGFNGPFEVTHKVSRKQLRETIIFRHVDRRVFKKTRYCLFPVTAVVSLNTQLHFVESGWWWRFAWGELGGLLFFKSAGI